MPWDEHEATNEAILAWLADPNTQRRDITPYEIALGLKALAAEVLSIEKYMIESEARLLEAGIK